MENGQVTFLKTSISVNKDQRGKKQTNPLTLTLQFNISSNPVIYQLCDFGNLLQS